MQHTLTHFGRCFGNGNLSSKSSNKFELFEGRVRVAVSQSELLGACDAIATLLEAPGPSDELMRGLATEVEQGQAILTWIRGHIKIACTVARQHYKEDFAELIKSLAWQSSVAVIGDKVAGLPTPEIPIRITALAPLSHGADVKAGNNTLYRRMQIIAKNNGTLSLPYYAGNAFRGQMRDLLADHLLSTLGIGSVKLSPWFHYAIYEGGSLSEVKSKGKPASGPTKETMKKIGEGANSTLSTEKVNNFRDLLPLLSLFGCAIGNQMTEGRTDFLDYLPECPETGFSGKQPASQFTDWKFFTRRDDRAEGSEDDNNAMIVNVETLKPGVVLIGGIDVRPRIKEIELACLHLGILEMIKVGTIGGMSRQGWGKVLMVADVHLDADPYLDFLKTNKATIVEYLVEIGAINVGAGNASGPITDTPY